LQIGKQFVVSTQVDQQLNNTRTQLFLDLLANPAGKHGEHAYNLQQLIAEYPQCGVLYALLVHTTNGDNLSRAAVYANPKVLFKLTHDTDNLSLVSAEQIIQLHHLLANTAHVESVVPQIGEGSEELLLEPWEGEEDFPVMDEIAEAPLIHTESIPAPVEVHEEKFSEVKEQSASVENTHTESAEEHEEELPAVFETAHEVEDLPPLTEQQGSVLEQIPYDGIFGDENEDPETSAEISSQINEPVPVLDGLLEEEEQEKDNIIEQVIPQEDLDPYYIQPIEDDVYDEIVSIDDINMAYDEIFAKAKGETPTEQYTSPFAAVLAENELAPVEPVKEEPIAKEPVKEEYTATVDRKVNMNDDAEKLIMNNIVSSDFFAFDKTFREHKDTPEDTAKEPQSGSVAVATTSATSAKKEEPYITVSKYHDDKMPYSFMWWLDKTRKEHSGIYQPYVEFKLDTTQSIKQQPSAPDELQQQYVENIFHITSVDDLEKTTLEQPIIFNPKVKEDKIIERFIQEVPQIKPQTGDKLDNENKAKKSSEDHADLVTETLAQIYIDQMLYPKAISVYKKLMLRFPEKSRYFASQIKDLEKRTN
jgi:hypothetical protein